MGGRAALTDESTALRDLAAAARLEAHLEGGETIPAAADQSFAPVGSRLARDVGWQRCPGRSALLLVSRTWT